MILVVSPHLFSCRFGFYFMSIMINHWIISQVLDDEMSDK